MVRCPPRGLLRLRSGEASPAAPAGGEAPCTRTPTFVIASEARQSMTTLALRLRSNKASPAASAGGEQPYSRTPTFVIASEARQSMTALALRLRLSKASPAAPAGLKKGMLLPLPCPHCSSSLWENAGMRAFPGRARIAPSPAGGRRGWGLARAELRPFFPPLGCVPTPFLTDKKASGRLATVNPHPYLPPVGEGAMRMQNHSVVVPGWENLALVCSSLPPERTAAPARQ